MKTIEDHPLAEIFPLLPDAEIDALGEDIAANDQQEDIWLYEGKILDGRNRYRACLRKSVAPRFREYTGKKPLDFVISKNLRRRHLTESQRAMVAARIATARRGRPELNGGNSPHLTNTQAADMLGVSADSVADAKTVQTKGVPELVAAVESGEVSVSAAAQVAKLPHDEQRETVAAGPKTVKAKAKKQRAKKPAKSARPAPDPAAEDTVVEDGPAPVDAWGIPVQPHAAEAFAAAPAFDALLAKLRECARDLSALVDSPAGGHLLKRVQWVKSASKAGGAWVLAHLDNAITAVSQSRPAVTDCPYAFNADAPHPEDCTLCRNLRWTASLKGHQIPPTLAAAMKTHYGVTESD